MLTEVLGWAHSDIGSESPNENGFSDYIVGDGDIDAFAVEAKKIGIIGIATQTTTKSYYKISGPVLKPAATGIQQVASYCHPLGVPLAVLTDGCTWILFLPWVPHANYRERQAIVFPGFDSILDDFAAFYELLSKEESEKATFRVIFDTIHENRLLLEKALEAPIASSENTLVPKSALAFDLDNVFSSFFASLSGDNDPDMLINCFVESRESRIADFALQRITQNVLGNINPSQTGVEEGLQAIVQNTVAGDLGQTIFIVGPSGSGKSTFLSRFFTRTLSSEVRERCLVIDINALDASGNETVAIPWMTERVISSIERQLFVDGYPEWNDLQALYQLEYIKRSKGIDAHLYNRSKDEFKEKFACFVEHQVEKDREGYLNRLLRDLVRNRKKLPIFVVDNTDEFSLQYKVAIFQYFQALRRAIEHCLLIFPATDRSAWSFSKTDIFNIYTSRSFFLPTPSPRQIFQKRIEYLKGKLQVSLGETKYAEYFVGRGIRVTIRDLGAFASVVESIFVDQDYASKRVGELSNYNIRETLRLSRRVITSSILNVEDLIRSYLTSQLAAPSPERFMNALVRGDYQFFKSGEEPLLFPLYQVDTTIRQSPLIHIRVLTLLQNLHTSATEHSARYITIGSIFAYFGVMSISEVAVQRSLEALLTAGLVEPYDLSKKDYSEDQRVAITYSGSAHLELGLFNPVYFEQMALTTRIVDGETAAQIRGAFQAKKGIDARLEEVRELFCLYLVAEDRRACVVPTKPEFEAQSLLIDKLVSQWSVAKAPANEMMQLPELAASSVSATVDWFNHFRGFGFVEVPELNDKAFLHISTVEQSGIDSIYDGDELLCDIKRTARGLAVSNIRRAQTPKSEVFKGTITALLSDRGYGFIRVPATGVDAFFHYSLFPTERQKSLSEGQELSVEIKTDKQGRSQVRRVVSFT
jgi:cold shock CspA family protein/KaiC/GvpD/RAD55 family RecA-like ATPase